MLESWFHKAESSVFNSFALQKAILSSSCAIYKPPEATIYYYILQMGITRCIRMIYLHKP